MVNFKNIYQDYIEKFKEKIKDPYTDNLFNSDIKNRIELERSHIKSNQDPETLTADIIREMLRECKIDPLNISREISIEGRGNSFERVRKKPDFYIESKNPEECIFKSII